MLNQLSKSVAALLPEEVDKGVKEALDSGTPVLEIRAALHRGAEEAGLRFEQGRYFVSDLIILAQVLKKAFEYLKPHLKDTENAEGVVVLGTILGDIHDIGKDIVSALLSSSGFRVHDLGVDVPGEEFVSKAVEVRADVIGVSVLYSGASLNLKGLSEDLSKKGLRGRVKVIVGGAAAHSGLVSEFGVDAVVNSAVDGVNVIRGWVLSARSGGGLLHEA